MNSSLHLLIIGDSTEDAELILGSLRGAGDQFAYERVDTSAAMKAALAKQTWDLIISDYKMSDFSGPAALEQLKGSGLDLPFIIVSRSIGEETAADVMRQGAHDYISKDNLKRLAPAVERELREVEIRRGCKETEDGVLLLQTITIAVSEAKDFHSALEILLDKMCSLTGWILGQVWIPRSDGALLECSRAFFSAGSNLEEFRKWNERLTFPPGTDLPGRAWSKKEPVWLAAVTADLDSLRAEMVRKAGLKSGVAIPVLAGDEVVAVVEFFVREPQKEDKDRIQMITSVAAQLGSVIQRKRSEEKIKHMAYYDTLTNLPNRAQLKDLLREAIVAAQSGNKPLALLFIDLKHFKEVNNALGHNLGDILLQQVGPSLKNAVGNSDPIARLGGDEFAMLLSGKNREEAIVVARKILKTMEVPFVVGALTLEVGASIGIALWPEHGEDADELMQGADVAMYMAKQSDNGYFVYVREEDQTNLRRLALMGDLRRAIDANQLFPNYQPKIDLKTGRITGVETLVRWQHLHFGVIFPDQFITLAEYAGLIRPLTFWVLNEALFQCEAWCQKGLKIRVAVNLSARNLQDPELPERIPQILQASGIAADQLELEITESVIMAEPLRAMETLTRLNGMGIRLSIDDFGTGYSSLGYLKKLPVNEVKIDKSFVKEMASNKDDAIIVRSTIDLAHNLGLKVVAEGVEDQETLDQLASFGCDEAQGYHISLPMAAENLIPWLNDTASLEGWRV